MMIGKNEKIISYPVYRYIEKETYYTEIFMFGLFIGLMFSFLEIFFI